MSENNRSAPTSTGTKDKRVTHLGDATHPTSCYVPYGAGMDIEDCHFLAKYLAGRDLADPRCAAGWFAAL